MELAKQAQGLEPITIANRTSIDTAMGVAGE
jgi:hypothetical protein